MQPMIFDPDKYLDEIQNARQIKQLKPPNNKVPPVNLPKLAFDKKIVPIVLDIRFADKFVLRDRFDWDLMEPRLRPIDFATALCNQLPFFKSEEHKQQTIVALSNSILDQINAHIEKNTFFPRIRFNRKEEEIISNDQVCVNCDSELGNNPDYCIHCGQQFEKKLGATTATGSIIGGGPKDQQQNSTALSSRRQTMTSLKATGVQESSSNLNASSSMIPQPEEVKKGEFHVPLPLNKEGETNTTSVNNEDTCSVPQQQLHKAKSTDPHSQQQTHSSLKQRIMNDFTFSGKERKVCKKCGEINPFFKNECSKCRFKFPKTRGLHNSGLASDSYTLYFWDILHSDPLFSSLNNLNDFLEERDFMCVRDLYKKIKEVLSQPNTERIFDISDTQLLDLHDSIDEKFELLLTNNIYTDHVFNDATTLRTGRKRTRQVMLNFREAQGVFNRKVRGQEQLEHQHQKPICILGKRDHEGRKFKPTVAETTFQSRFKNRPHNFESNHLQTIVGNISLLHQMGFLEPQVLASETVNRIMIEHDSAMSNVRKRGRPRKFDLTYEDMMNVDQLDDSKLVFQNNLFGGQGGDEDDRNEMPVLQPNGVLSAPQKKIVEEDGNVDVCGICYNGGKLICCDDCPAAFHADCLGYERQFPRGKWKCYFCKVTKHGLKSVQRMAPSEKPLCDALAEDLDSWEDKALHLLDILKNYQCMSTFFEEIELTPEQVEQIQKNRQTLPAVSEGQEEVKEPLLAQPQTVQDIYDQVANNATLKKYSSYQEFYEALKQSLSYYYDGLDKHELLSLEARACLALLEKLIVDCEIFTFIKPPDSNKKKDNRMNASSSRSKIAPQASNAGPQSGRPVTRAQLGKNFSRLQNVKDADSEDEYDQEEDDDDDVNESQGSEEEVEGNGSDNEGSEEEEEEDSEFEFNRGGDQGSQRGSSRKASAPISIPKPPPNPNARMTRSSARYLEASLKS